MELKENIRREVEGLDPAMINNALRNVLLDVTYKNTCVLIDLRIKFYRIGEDSSKFTINLRNHPNNTYIF